LNGNPDGKKNNPYNNKKENRNKINNDINYNQNDSYEEDNWSNIENINTSNLSNGIINNKIRKKGNGNHNRISSLNYNKNTNNSLNIGYAMNNLAAKNKAEIIKGIFYIIQNFFHSQHSFIKFN
jgi:hypothetical protein